MNPTVSQVELLTRILDVGSLRHKVIAQNVANVNTPGYVRLEVAFEEELASQLPGGWAQARDVRPQVVTAEGGPIRADGNNVSLEKEMGDLNKNNLLYTTAVQLLTARLATLRSAVSGR